MIHLHCHSRYSILDSISSPKDIVKKIKELGQTTIALTDHHTTSGLFEFEEECIKADIKGLYGCEVVMTEDCNNRDRDLSHHLVLIAQTQQGYKNLLKLVTAANDPGAFFYTMRADWGVLERYAEGLIATSACLAGIIPTALMEERWDDAVKYANKLNTIFQNKFFLEIQPNRLTDQLVVNHRLIELSKKTGIPLVLGADSHYPNQEDSSIQLALFGCQTKKTIQEIVDEGKYFTTDDFYLCSEEDVRERLQRQYIPEDAINEAISNTDVIGSMCDQVKICIKGDYAPKFDSGDISVRDYFNREIEIGWKNKIEPVVDPGRWDEYRERIQTEVDVIQAAGFEDYFLITQDYVKYARTNNVTVGDARGSGTGCLLLYILDVTGIDPILYGLLFERFLNKDRISPPDECLK